MSTLTNEQKETLLKIADKFFDYTYSRSVVKFSRHTTPASWLVLAFDKGDKTAQAIKSGLKTKEQIENYIRSQSKTSAQGHPLGDVNDSVHVHSHALFGPCHAGFPIDLDTYGDNVIVASNLEHFPKESESYTYIKYLLDKEKSPFRKLLSFGYNIHYTDQFHSGISFCLKDIPIEYRGAIKSFFIACRLTREFPSHARTFHKLVKEHGIDPRVAHLMLGNAGEGRSKKLLYINQYTLHKGTHWALSVDPYDWGLNPVRFFSGDMNIEAMSPRRRVAPYWKALYIAEENQKRWGIRDRSEEGREFLVQSALLARKVNSPFSPLRGEPSLTLDEMDALYSTGIIGRTLFAPTPPTNVMNVKAYHKAWLNLLREKGVAI